MIFWQASLPLVGIVALMMPAYAPALHRAICDRPCAVYERIFQALHHGQRTAISERIAETDIGGGAKPTILQSGRLITTAQAGGGPSTAGSECAAQHPSLLSAYKWRPAWRVAGVDYCVGHATNAPLKNAATISMAGVSVNAIKKIVTVTGNDVTLDGYDFRGWNVVTTAANTRLINARFDGMNPGGTQSSVISGASTSSSLYVGHSTIDGMAGAGGHAQFLVEMQGPGLTIEYSWLKNSNSDLIGRHGRSGGDLVIQNNLLEQAGMGGPGTHGDYLQVYGPTIESTSILFNTAIQNDGITQGFIADNTKSGEFAGNTMIGSVSYWMSVSGPGTDAANLTGSFNTHDNYFDTSKALGFNYPAAGPNDRYHMTSFANNVNMRTGAIVQDAVCESSGGCPSPIGSAERGTGRESQGR
jgi:hypothetical protein